MLVRAGELVKQCCLSTILISHQRIGKHRPLRQRILIFLRMIFSFLTKSRMLCCLQPFTAGVAPCSLIDRRNLNLSASASRSVSSYPCTCSSIGSPIGANFTTVTSAPGIIPMSRKCCRNAPFPPTVRITALLPVSSSFNVISFALFDYR